ncbi:MAG: hypothetical protein LDL11_08650 [Desulfarculus sp.]|nr:hypothetical protein [Desulfarculus sp.]
MEELLDIPRYSVPFAARLVGLSSRRVSRWLMGYHRKSSDSTRKNFVPPLVQRQASAMDGYASFLDLIDLLYIKAFLNNSLSIKFLHGALSEARELLNTNHFAHKRFYIDGKRLYLEIKDDDKHPLLVQLLSKGQQGFGKIIPQIAQQIVFDEISGYALKWYPSINDRSIVINPSQSFGLPSIEKRGITTKSVYTLYRAEKNNINIVCSWFEITKAEAESAIRYQLSISKAA